MLGDSNWKNSLKYKVKTKMLISLAVFFIASTLKFMTQGLLQIILLITFLLITPIFVFFIYDFSLSYFKNIRLIFQKKNIIWKKDLPPNIKALAKKMNVKVKKFGIQKGLYNAYATYNKTVILGEKFEKSFNKIVIEAIMAHEFAHITRHHTRNATLLICFLSIPVVLPIGPQLVEPINSLAMIAYLYIMLIFVMHYREYDADKTASKFVGIKNFHEALRAFTKKNEYDIETEDHPSTRKRIKNVSS
jgi:Zn-dependent protease with chaperone function